MSPYIKQTARDELDPLLEPLLNKLQLQEPEKMDGDISYVIARFGARLYKWNFFEMNRFDGILDNAKDEWRRKVLHPYEDEKRNINGDVYE